MIVTINIVIAIMVKSITTFRNLQAVCFTDVLKLASTTVLAGHCL